MKISANILVENEENFVWFSVMSVLPYVDEVILYDAGSVDETREIVEILKKEHTQKIILKHLHKLTKEEYPHIRQEMLTRSIGDWIIIVDGDEIWWNDGIKEAIRIIYTKGSQLDSLTSKFINCVPDLFHVQDEKASRYKIDGKQGNRTIHAINKHIVDLHVSREYGKEGFFSGNTLIQDLPRSRRYSLQTTSFLHCTHLPRTHVHQKKVKREFGESLPRDFYYPECLFYKTPSIVPYPFVVSNSKHSVTVSAISGLKYIKRRVL